MKFQCVLVCPVTFATHTAQSAVPAPRRFRLSVAPFLRCNPVSSVPSEPRASHDAPSTRYCALRRLTHERRGLPAHPLLVTGLDGRHHPFHRAGFHQGDDRSAEACASQAGAGATRLFDSQVNQRVEFRRRYLVQIPKAGVRVHHQAARAGEIAAREGVRHCRRPPVLGDDMRRATQIDRRQRRRLLCQHRVVGVTQRPHPAVSRSQGGDDALARCATLVVGARRQLAPDAAVEDDDARGFWNRNVADAERTAVDEEPMALRAPPPPTADP